MGSSSPMSAWCCSIQAVELNTWRASRVKYYGKSHQRIVVSLVSILATVFRMFVYSQPANRSWLTETERARFEKLRITGSEALFNLDYGTARKNFKEMADAFPGYPGGPQFLADTLWAETLYDSRRLQSSLYGDDDTFYSTSDDKV